MKMQIKTTKISSQSNRAAQIQSTDTKWWQRSFCSLLVEMQDGVTTLEDSLEVAVKMEHPPPISGDTPWYLLQRAENLCLHKKLHMNIYRSFIYNCQNLTAAKMSFSR